MNTWYVRQATRYGWMYASTGNKMDFAYCKNG